MATVELRNLTKTFPGSETNAVDDLSIKIEEGEFTVLMGSSGSGKSTLLYVLSGLEQSSTGGIHFAGQRIDALSETELSLLRRTGIGFVFQAINLVPHLTLFENVVVPGYRELKEFFELEYLPNCRKEVGITALEGGTEYYQYLIEYFTTTSMTPEEIHQLGLSEVERIRGEMRAIIESVGFDGDFRTFLEYLRETCAKAVDSHAVHCKVRG